MLTSAPARDGDDMFGRKSGDAPGVSEKEVFEHVMSTLYGLGQPGALITPGKTAAARDLSKSQACEALAARGGSAREVRATQSAYDHVGNRVAAMFGANGPYAGSTFPGGEDTDSSEPTGAHPDGPCPAGEDKLSHVPTQMGDGPSTCYYCGTTLRDA